MSQTDTAVLQQNRRKLADLVTATVQQTADVLEQEQTALALRFPAMANQPAPVMIDPSAIRDFAQSEQYQQVIAAYVAGRLEVNLLVKVLDLLEKIAPLEFLRR
jgi:hypothetical protein